MQKTPVLTAAAAAWGVVGGGGERPQTGNAHATCMQCLLPPWCVLASGLVTGSSRAPGHHTRHGAQE
jgi:hypothetical protein